MIFLFFFNTCIKNTFVSTIKRYKDREKREKNIHMHSYLHTGLGKILKKSMIYAFSVSR
jgi:hypothetical protein